MDKNFLMGVNDPLNRYSDSNNWETYLSHNVSFNFLKIAIKEAFEFYQWFFDIESQSCDFDQLAELYNREFEEAQLLDLFQDGGIREKDHLNLWCLSRVLAPEFYLESGVFIGSSMHAFMNSPDLKSVVGIDPNLDRLLIPEDEVPSPQFIADKDFSQLELGDNLPEKSLAFFDDHINSAQRLIQAKEKGFKYVLFDDSPGVQGVCQRLYPAVPTIPMILNWEAFEPGDEMAWTVESPKTGLIKSFKRIIMPGQYRSKRVKLTVDEDFLEQCNKAKNVIKHAKKIPDLGDYIPQAKPQKMMDTSKFLLELDV